MFNYQELLSLQEAAELAGGWCGWVDAELVSKINKLIEDAWNPGFVLPPMHSPFVIRVKEFHNKEFTARRISLAESYAPSEVALVVKRDNIWEEHTFKGDEFSWRYL